MRGFRTALVLSMALLMSACGNGDSAAPFKVQDYAKGSLAGLDLSKIGTTAPTIPFESRGSKVTAADFKGRVLVLNLWATWCAPCIKELPSLDQLQGGFKTTDLQVVLVSQDVTGWPAIDKLWPKLKMQNVDSYLDIDMGYTDAFRTPGLPLTIIYDRKGKEIARMMKPVDWNSPEAKALFTKLVAQPL